MYGIRLLLFLYASSDQTRMHEHVWRKEKVNEVYELSAVSSRGIECCLGVS